MSTASARPPLSRSIAVALTIFANALVAAREPIDDPFLPAIDHVKKPASAWLDDFKKGGPSALDALWCVHFCGDRSRETIDTLRASHARADDTTKRAIETILCEWNVPCDDLFPKTVRTPPAEEPGESAKGPDWLLASDPFDLPLPLLAARTSDLLAIVHTGDAFSAARAAITLGRNQERTVELVSTLLRRVYAESRGAWRGDAITRDEWLQTDGNMRREARHLEAAEALGFALREVLDSLGAAGDDAVLAELERTGATPEYRAFLLRQVKLSRHPDPGVLRGPLVEVIQSGGELSKLAVQRLLLTCGFRFESWATYPNFAHDAFHAGGQRVPLADEPIERLLADALDADFAWRTRENDFANGENGCIDLWLHAALRSLLVRERFITLLTPLASRLDRVGEDAVFALSHVGADSKPLRDAFAMHVARRIASGATRFDRIGCLVAHDGATLAALANAFTAAEDKAELAWPLAAGGLFAVTPQPDLVGKFAAWCDAPVIGTPEDEAAHADARSLLLAFRPDRFAEIEKHARPHALANAADVLRDRGLDPSRQLEGLMQIVREPYPESGGDGAGDYWEWSLRYLARYSVVSDELVAFCLGRLQDADSFSSHQNGACMVLLNATLDARQKALLGKTRYFSTLPYRFHELAARQGAAAIETVPWMRSTDLSMISTVASITRLSPPEQDVLVRAIENGSAVDRESALRVIETTRSSLGSITGLEALVSNRCDDADRFVAAAARAAKARLARDANAARTEGGK